jgi:hypothetical protein
MNEKQFKEISFTISQIGFYLMNLGDISLFNDTQIHNNIVVLLSQAAMKLNDAMKAKTTVINEISCCNSEKMEEHYISKQQVVEMFHPFITQYSLTQAIHTNSINYLKRGNKYFFLESEVKEWISKKKNNSINTNSVIRTCNKFV